MAICDRRRFFAQSTRVAIGMCGIVPGLIGMIQRSAAPVAAAPGSRQRPEVNMLESGDFLWPKQPEAFVAYNSRIVAGAYEDERVQWERERTQFVTRVKASATASQEERLAADEIANLTFREFYGTYLGDERRDVPGEFGGTFPLYVGHVGIVLVSEGGPWVLEAIMGKGVRRIGYETWLAERPGELVWHARIRDTASDQRATIAAEALRHQGKVYDFWNFDLADDSAFYCSKLVWLSVVRALSIVPDDKPSPRRGIWFSPRQLMKSRHIYFLNDPGSYLLPNR